MDESLDRKATVVFLGSPEFAVPTLEAIRDNPRFDVLRVVTQPDRPSGRGKKLAPTPVKAYAAAKGLPTWDMSKENYAEVAKKLAALKPDFVVVAAFGIILRADLLSLPKYGCINLHASLLPKYRGVSPIQAAILSGDAFTGCTTMLMDRGVDTGPIILEKTIRIDADDTAGSLEARLAKIGAGLVVTTLEGLLSGKIQPKAQDESGASYTKKVKKDHGRIDWNRGPDAAWRHVRAMTPWPGAFTFYKGNRLILAQVKPCTPVIGAARPGAIVTASPLVVACRGGALEIIRLKVAGKKEMDAKSFVAGYRVAAGDALE